MAEQKKTNTSTFVTLREGVKMPLISLGTWKSPKGKAGEAVRAALDAGYRGIDCANDYANEAEIGQVLKEYFDSGKLKREDVFIQAKLWNTNHQPAHVREDLMATLKDLQLSYVDSYLVHWPQASPATGKKAALNKDGARIAHYREGTMFPVDDNGIYVVDKDSHYTETWAVFEDLVDEGLCKSIGLSNFNFTQISEILSVSKRHKPSILQNECHPYLQLKDLLDFCNIHQIQLQAYMPLGSKDRPCANPGDPELLEDARIKAIADKHKKSVAQVVLRWHVQRGVAACPKSVNADRIRENLNVFDFELTDADMKEFDRFNIHHRLLLNPESSGHPDFPWFDDIPRSYKLGPPTPAKEYK